MKILITGGSGYVGSVLINKLIKKKHEVYNVDLDLFGNTHLPFKNKLYHHINQDIRKVPSLDKYMKNVDIVFHLACISNDPTFELNKKLSKEINYDCFENIVLSAKKNKVKKFIYISTCSVYGISKKPKITEIHPLKPITEYNKFKGMCEPILLKHLDDKFKGCIIRPATVCGYSTKMRFDLTVNILTNFAYNKNYIKVFGGKQLRPNIHIDDLTNLYVKLVNLNFSKINKQIFNVGYENLSIENIAKKVKRIVSKYKREKILIKFEKSNDKRSYHIDSSKIKKYLNFKPKYTVEKAIHDLCIKFKKGFLNDSFENENYFNVKKLKKIKFK